MLPLPGRCARWADVLLPPPRRPSLEGTRKGRAAGRANRKKKKRRGRLRKRKKHCRLLPSPPMRSLPLRSRRPLVVPLRGRPLRGGCRARERRLAAALSPLGVFVRNEKRKEWIVNLISLASELRRFSFFFSFLFSRPFHRARASPLISSLCRSASPPLPRALTVLIISFSR